MKPAERPSRALPKLIAINAVGTIRHYERTDLADMFEPGDLVVANDAATLPASLRGRSANGSPMEIRLAGWVAAGEPHRFLALAFGAGDHRTPTEHRPPAPPIAPGDCLTLGPLTAIVESLVGDPRLCIVRFPADRRTFLHGLARHGRPIQYAHVADPLSLWDVWTPLAAVPFAFEPPSAGFAVDWRTRAAWRVRGIEIASLTHAAGLSSTGDAGLDARLPFDERYSIPVTTARAVSGARARGARIVAIGTTVVRALEDAAAADGTVPAGAGIARGRLGHGSRLSVVDAILTGIHQLGESHFDLLRAFAEEDTLARAFAEAEKGDYRTHEFGDSMLIERSMVRLPQPAATPPRWA